MGNQTQKEKGTARKDSALSEASIIRQRDGSGSVLSLSGTAAIEAIKANKKIGRLLSSVPLLARLTEADRGILGGCLVSQKYNKGDIIIRQGEDGTGFYIIKRGEVVVTRLDEDKKEEELGRLKAGDYFGEAALLNPGSKRNATVSAATDSKIWFLDQKHFKTFFTKDGGVKFAQRVAVSAEKEAADGKRGPSASGPPSDAVREKDEKMTNLILEAISSNILFKNRERTAKLAVIKEMWRKEVKAGTELITQGARGENFYVVQEGKFDVFINDKHEVTFGEKGAFGELALMYNTPRAATVKAVEDSIVWVVDRNTFRRVIKEMSKKRLANYVTFLAKVELLSPLATYERKKIAELLEKVKFKAGEVIFKQGDQGDAMYIVQTGEGTITKHEEGSTEEKTVGTIKKGDAFGERALLMNEPRAATVTATGPLKLLKLVRDDFHRLLGPLEELMKERLGESGLIKTPPEPKPEERKTEVHTEAVAKSKEPKIEYKDLKVVGMLGKGAFGTVNLVKDQTTGKTYALKSVSKALVVEAGQEAHIMGEKRIMEQLNHPFIIKLHQTYKDKKYLYFLMEVSLGGDFFGYLREKFNFPDKTAKFYAACVVLIMEHMHSLDIIYRDLKPENLLVDSNGYIKMVDFGFACWIGNGRTFTLCGTPDYMAPEIVAGKGHGKGVDLWTLGVLIYEMLAGYAPFYDEDPMKMYEKISSGFIAFPEHFSKEAKEIIWELLQLNPNKRLGVGKDGFKRLKKHSWFRGIDWAQLAAGKIKSPYVPNIKNVEDLSNFHQYSTPPEPEATYVDDRSGWDADFGEDLTAAST